MENHSTHQVAIPVMELVKKVTGPVLTAIDQLCSVGKPEIASSLLKRAEGISAE